ncbi:hypothetical protein GCM10009689_28000 [Brevibacterium antiquum]
MVATQWQVRVRRGEFDHMPDDRCGSAGWPCWGAGCALRTDHEDGPVRTRGTDPHGFLEAPVRILVTDPEDVTQGRFIDWPAMSEQLTTEVRAWT